MASKALAKRQQLAARAKPGPRGLKQRNPFAIAAGKRSAGPHRRTASALRQQQKRVLKKLLPDSGEE